MSPLYSKNLHLFPITFKIKSLKASVWHSKPFTSLLLPTTYSALTLFLISSWYGPSTSTNLVYFHHQVSILAPLLAFNIFLLPPCWSILIASFKTHFKICPFQEAFPDSLTVSLIFCFRTDFNAIWLSSTLPHSHFSDEKLEAQRY